MEPCFLVNKLVSLSMFIYYNPTHLVDPMGKIEYTNRHADSQTSEKKDAP